MHLTHPSETFPHLAEPHSILLSMLIPMTR